MEERKNPTALCILVILGALVCYLVSLGPACWCTSRFGGEKVVTLAYRPVTFAAEAIGNEGLMEAIRSYSALGVSKPRQWTFSPDAPGHAEWAPAFYVFEDNRVIIIPW